MQLISTCTDRDSPLIDRRLAVSRFLGKQISRGRWPELFPFFAEVHELDERGKNDDQLLAECQDAGIDTFMAHEYMAHSDARRRRFRQAGLRYWHIGLGVAAHYRTARIDWAMYESDTWLRHATSPDRLPAASAIPADSPIKRVLVIGQVHGDQAQQYGGLGFNSCLLMSEVRDLLPDAEIRYRPHPESLRAVPEHKITVDTTWYPDPYLAWPDEDVLISQNRTLADDIEWADACATINSTAAYESLLAGVPVYHAGIPLLHEHPGGCFRLGQLADGKRYVSRDYQDRLRGRLNEMQGQVYGLGPELFLKHELYMLGDWTGEAVAPRPKVRGRCLGDLDSFRQAFDPGSHVLICGTGPSLHRARDINLKGYTVIAVNSACNLVDPDLLMLMNVNCWRYPLIWEHLRGRMHLLSDLLAANAGRYPYDYHTFKHLPPVDDPVFEPWLLSSSAGVAFRAIQLAASYPQVKAIHMVGLDSYNWQVHWQHVDKAPDGPPFKPYGAKVRAANKLIRALRTRIDFAHFGPTSLKVKVK